jgi:Redoxin
VLLDERARQRDGQASRQHAVATLKVVLAHCAVLAGLCGAAPATLWSASSQRDTTGVVDLHAVRVLDLEGRTLEPLQHCCSSPDATIFVFTTIDCPISSRYAPELQRLHEELAARGVRVVLVYANHADGPEAVRAHVARFGLRADAVRDPRQSLVQAVGATVSPEAVLVDARGSVKYRGRIDDRYVEFGRDRPHPTRQDLRDAVTAVLEGRAVATPVTKAIGCFLADFRR